MQKGSYVSFTRAQPDRLSPSRLTACPAWLDSHVHQTTYLHVDCRGKPCSLQPDRPLEPPVSRRGSPRPSAHLCACPDCQSGCQHSRLGQQSHRKSGGRSEGQGGRQKRARRERCFSYDSEGGSTEGLLGLQAKTVQIQNVRASRPRRSEGALQRRKRRA